MYTSQALSIGSFEAYETNAKWSRNPTEMRNLAVIGFWALVFAGSEVYSSWDSGAGIVYTLQAT